MWKNNAAHFRSFKVLCEHWPNLSAVESILISARICTEIPLFHLYIWCLCLSSSAKFLLHVLWVRYPLLLNKKVVILYILIFKKQQHGLASMSKCNFPLSSALNWNKEFATHTTVWYLIFWKIFCSSGHNFSFEILKGSHTTTGKQKGKLLLQKAQKYKMWNIVWN